MAVVWDKVLFDSMYVTSSWRAGLRQEAGQPYRKPPAFNYNWFGMLPTLEVKVDVLLSVPGAAQITDLCVIGGGFGWTAEILESRGINTINVDTSEFVLANASISEEQDIRDRLTAIGLDPDNLPDMFMSPVDPNATVNPWAYWLHPSGARSSKPVIGEDLSTNQSRRAVRQAISNNMDAIFTEFVIDGFDAETDVLTFVDRVQQLRPNPACNVIHMCGSQTFSPEIFLDYTAQQYKDLLTANGFTDHYVVDQTGRVYL